MFPLEHFFYGQLVHRGKSQDNMRLLSKSAGITDEQVAEAVRFALASPSEHIDQGAWALVRGRRTPFFLVQSQKGSAGEIIMHYVIMPSDVLRTMAGNVKALATLIQDKLPIFNQLGDELVPLTLTNPGTLATDAQVDDLLDLMTYAKNKMSNIEKLLGAVVKGLQLIVVNAPADHETRINFIQGLLTLLPSSTRYGVTFATASDSKTQMNLQVRFIDDGKAPAGSVVYDWNTGTLEGSDTDDEYSHFIVSQFRLDASLVIQQTEALTPIAGWRFRNGDSLSQALAYASHRTKIDKAVATNQPVEVADVSKILSEDPTLTPDLRVSYSKHLVNLSLAIEDMQYAEPVAAMLHNNPSLAKDIYQQLNESLDDGHAYLIYETLFDWMSHPLGPQGKAWGDLTYKAALSYLDELIEDQDHDAIDVYVDSIQSASTGIAIGRVVPDVIKKLTPQIEYDNEIAMPLLSLAIQHMPKNDLAAVLNNPAFRNLMPQTMTNFLLHLYNQILPPAPRGTMMAAIESLSTKSQKDALLKFTQMAEDNQRGDLIDSEVLEGLFKTTQSTETVDHAAFLLKLVNDILDKDLKQLDDDGPLYLLQILYFLHQYDQLTKSMIKVSRDYFGVDRQFDYIAMVQKLFASIKISANDATTVLVVIRRNGIKGLPYLTASIGILEGTGWSEELGRIAEEAIIMLDENPRYLRVMQPATLLALLEYYARHKNVDKMIEVGQFIPDVAVNRADAGPSMIRNMLKLMNRERHAKSMSFEYLRSYIRKADYTTARKAVRHFGQNLGKGAQRRLNASLTMSRFMGGVDLITYANLLDLGVGFLKDTAEAYHNNRPSTGQLRDMIENIRVNFDVDDRVLLGNTLVDTGKAIMTLQRQHKDSGNRNLSSQLQTLENSNTILDIFLIISSVLGRKRRFQVQLEPFIEDYPFFGQTGEEVLDEADIINNILRATLLTLPTDKPIKLTSKEIADEIESQLRLIPANDRDAIANSIAENLQILVFLVSHLGNSGDTKTLSDHNLSNRIDETDRPRNTIELYRYIYGYFNQ